MWNIVLHKSNNKTYIWTLVMLVPVIDLAKLKTLQMLSNSRF